MALIIRMQRRFVSGDEFANWLNQHRQEGLLHSCFRLTAMKISIVSPFRPLMPSIVRTSGTHSVSAQMIWLTLVFASLLSVAGQLCQKQATCFAAVNKRRKHIVLWLGLALACLGLAMVLWLLVLQNVPVGIAYPMLSLNFVWVTLAAVKLWHEPVSLRHWCGVAFIIGGIVILGSTV